MTLFGPDFLTRLEYLSLISRRVFRGQLMAARRARQAGGGIEFAQHREYAPGDDFRHLDWNLYARHDELLLKRFHEETDLHVYLLLDTSRSMDFGAPSKFDLARQITASLAYLALSDLDRVSVCAFAGGLLQMFPLSRGKTSILRLMKFLESLEADGDATSLAQLATEFTNRPQRTGMAIVISDLFDPSGFRRGLDLLRHHQYEPHVVQVHHPDEAEPSAVGDMELVDAESGVTRHVTVTPRRLKDYRAAFRGFLQDLSTYCAKNHMFCVIARTDATFDELILTMLRQSVVTR